MHSRLRITEFLLLPSLATLPLFDAQQVSVKVVSKTDGDTIEVLVDGKAKHIRLYGIDALDKSQAYGTKAKQFTSRAAFGKTVTVNLKDKELQRLQRELSTARRGPW